MTEGSRVNEFWISELLAVAVVLAAPAPAAAVELAAAAPAAAVELAAPAPAPAVELAAPLAAAPAAAPTATWSQNR